MGPSNSELRLILEAIGNGVVLNIQYNGGSDPGSFRDIQPNKITETMVWAFCHSSNAVKQFALSKIASVSSVRTKSESGHIWNPKIPIKSYSDLNSYFEDAAKFQSERLTVKFEGDDEENSIMVFERFKNGKLKGTSTISLSYEKWAYDFVLNSNGEIEAVPLGQKARPFTVRSKSATTVSFSKLQSAIDRFEAQVTALK